MLVRIIPVLLFLLAFSISGSNDVKGQPITGGGIANSDSNLIELSLNLEYFEAEFFLNGALGYGLDRIAPGLAAGGPAPVGATMANLTSIVKDIIAQFGYQEVGHLRAIRGTVAGFPRPQLNLSREIFSKVVNDALGESLKPPFDPYANDINYLIASYLIPYVGLTGYVGANPKLQSQKSKRLVAGLLGVESGQDAVIRTILYQRKNEKVTPYGITVAEFTNRISELRNKLGKGGVKDEGLEVEVPRTQSAEGNILSADANSISYERSPEEILRIVYGSGNERKPGGFYPKGANGKIARSYL